MGVDTSQWPYFCSFFRSYSAMFGGSVFEGLWESRDFPSLSQKSDLIFSSAGEKRSWVTGTPMTQIKVFAEPLAPQNCSPWAFYPTSDPFITDVWPSRASASKSVSVSPARPLHQGAQGPLSLRAPPPTCMAPGNVNHRPSRCSQTTVSSSFYFGSNIKLLGRFGRSCAELRQA